MIKLGSHPNDVMVFVVNDEVEIMVRMGKSSGCRYEVTSAWHRINRDEVVELHKMLGQYLDSTRGL